MKRLYSVIMNEDQLRLFSRHTPDNLEKYIYENLSDKEIKKLSDGEIDAIIDSDAIASDKNMNKYINKKLPKYMLTGTGAGVGLGLLAPKGMKGVGALTGGTLGLSLGYAAGAARGAHMASKEGHSRDIVPKKAARKIDKIRKKGNAYQRMKEREDRALLNEIQRQRLNADLDRNAALWSLAFK